MFCVPPYMNFKRTRNLRQKNICRRSKSIPCAFEAFNCLIDHRLIPLFMLNDVVSHMKFESVELDRFYKNFYYSQLNIEDNIPMAIVALSKHIHLPTNLHILSCAMSYFYQQGQYNTSLTISKHILKLNAMHQTAILHFHRIRL